jgi:hypothetical protein
MIAVTEDVGSNKKWEGMLHGALLCPSLPEIFKM